MARSLTISISNLAWALGHLIGSAGGAALADATAYAIPYALLGALCAITLAGVIALGRGAAARSAAAR